MWYAAVSQNNAMAYILLFFLGSLTVLSMNYTHFNLVGLRLKIDRIEPVFAGSDAEVPMEITIRRAANGMRWNWSRRTASRITSPRFPAGAACARPACGGDNVPGEHPLPRITLRSIYPLGFSRVGNIA